MTPDGFAVQGYTAIDPVTGQIITTGQPSDITVAAGRAARAGRDHARSQTVTNLDANAATGATFTASVQVYDALGAPHVATVTYTKTATAGAWNYEITVPGAEIAGGTAGTPFPIGSGTAVFDTTGKLKTVTAAAPATAAARRQPTSPSRHRRGRTAPRPAP